MTPDEDSCHDLQASLAQLASLAAETSRAQRSLHRAVRWALAGILVVLCLHAVVLLVVLPRWGEGGAGQNPRGSGGAGRGGAGTTGLAGADAGSPAGQSGHEGLTEGLTGGLEIELASLRGRVAELGRERDGLEEQLKAQASLSEKLRHELARKDAALQDALGRMEELARAAEERRLRDAERGFEPLTEEPALVARDPVVEAINLLFMEGGLTTYRLLHVDRVDSERHLLEGTIWSLCNERGTAIGGIHAARCRITLDSAAAAARVVLEDGYVTRAGEKKPFAGGRQGFVVAGIDAERWVGALRDVARIEDDRSGPAGEKSVASQGETVGPDEGTAPGATLESAEPLDASRVAHLTEVLRGLLEPAGYDVVAVQGVDSGALRDIRLERTGEKGHFKVIEARECHIYRVQPAGYIELRFHGGFIEDRGGRRPFVEDDYRLPLPAVDVAAWRKGLGDLVVDRT